MGPRFAVYFAPEPDSALARFGACWLGRDVATGAAVEHPVVEDLSPARLDAITAAPRHYGFHATLKPPFALATGHAPEDLYAAAETFAARRHAFTAPPLKIASLDGFVALMLADRCPEMDRLAADCVRHFDRFRAPPSAADIAKREAAGLNARQHELLERWGYPYVMEQFRFHMTLTERLAPPERGRALAALQPLVAAVIDAPLAVDAIAIYRQGDRAEPFRLVGRYRFAG